MAIYLERRDVAISIPVNYKLTAMIKEIESGERKITPNNFDEMKYTSRD